MKMEKGPVVWGEVNRNSKSTPFKLCHSIKRPSCSSFCYCVSKTICDVLDIYIQEYFYGTLFILAKNAFFSAIFTKCKQKILTILKFSSFSSALHVFWQIFKEFSGKKIKNTPDRQQVFQIVFLSFTWPITG